MIRARGFILPLCLLLLGVASMLTLSLWQVLIAGQKAVADFSEMRRVFEVQDTIVSSLSHLSVPGCTLPGSRQETLITALHAGGGCRFETPTGHGYYLVQDLGEDACLRVGDAATHHWRVAAIGDTHRGRVLVVRHILKGTRVPCTTGDMHQVPEGLVSWLQV